MNERRPVFVAYWRDILGAGGATGHATMAEAAQACAYELLRNADKAAVKASDLDAVTEVRGWADSIRWRETPFEEWRPFSYWRVGVAFDPAGMACCASRVGPECGHLRALLHG